MITERMEESLVLLADLLCVPLESVAIVKNQNVRPWGNVKKLSKGNRDKLEKYLQTDRLIYDHFLRRLDTRIRWEVKSKSKEGKCEINWHVFSSYGKARMARDVKALRKINENLSQKCQDKDNKCIVQKPCMRYESIRYQLMMFIAKYKCDRRFF